tara:strand:- start:1043 stop:1885 length:843 start_codon:yes stop_codon:yes gene_type:complete
MTFIERELSVLTTNDPNSAFSINTNRNRWSFNYPGSITFPQNARDLTVEIPAAQVWYSSHLVQLGVNDLVEVTIGGATQTITFPPGLWSVSDLNTKLQELITVAFNTNTHVNKITIEGEAPTGRIKVIFSLDNATVLRLTFPVSQSIGALLGWNNGNFVDNSTFIYTGGVVISPNQANFDAVGSYLFCSNLGGGIPVNSARSGVLAQIPINAPAGGQILFQPPIPAKVDVSGLVGKTLNVFEFFILDQSGNDVIFNQEIHTFLLTFRWLEPPSQFSPNFS